MKAFRYELFFDDEPQECGIFAGMSELDIDDDMLYNIEGQFKELQIPETFIERKPLCYFWFTEKGNQVFSNAINNLINLYSCYSIFSIKKIEKDIDERKVVYRDDYQIAIPIF